MGRTYPNNVTCLNFFLPSFNSSSHGQKMATILAANIFKCIFLNKNDKIPIPIAMKLVLRIPIDNKPALVQVMAWHQTGDKPLTEPMMVSLPTHICITRPQWVKQITSKSEENSAKIHLPNWQLYQREPHELQKSMHGFIWYISDSV